MRLRATKLSAIGFGGARLPLPSLDLQFATDKTLTARKGPTPTFTRASGSAGSVTYFGPRTIIVNSVSLTQNSTTIGGRFYWTSPNAAPETYDYQATYNGTRWVMRIRYWFDGESYDETQALAAIGSEWRPDLANWSGTAVTITPTSSYGIVKAADNEPRFDYDPITLACKGLLIEERRTNSLLDSNSFNTWGLTGAVVVSSSVVTPEGTANTWKPREDSATSTHSITRAFTPVSGTTYTVSAWLKAAENTFALFGLTGSGFPLTFISVNLSTGAVTTAVGSPVGASSASYPNGWYRVSFTATATAASSSNLDIRLTRDGIWANRSYLGNGVNGIYCYGAQVEIGTFLTSYMPTTSSAVLRAVDLCSISGSDFTGFWNQSAGTLVESFEASPNTNTSYVSASNGNIEQNSLHLDNDTGVMRAVYYSGSSIVATLSLGAIGTVGTVNTISTAYSVNDFAASRNGAAVVVDTSGAVPASLTQINIGADERSQTPTSFYSNRCIKYLRYYKKRLPNAKLQTLST